MSLKHDLTSQCYQEFILVLIAYKMKSDKKLHRITHDVKRNTLGILRQMKIKLIEIYSMQGK